MNKMFKIVGVIIVLLGLTMSISTWVVYSQDSRIVIDNLKAKAIITEKYYLASADGDSDFMLKYYFIDKNNKAFNSNRGVSEELYNKISGDDTIEVHYSKGNPQRNFPVGRGHTSIKIVFL